MTLEHEPEPLSPEKLEKLMRDRFERPLPKRFYREVALAEQGAEYAITLDGRPVKTPLKAPLTTPSRALAEAIAAEWEAQAEVINPALMPLTKLLNTTIDRVAPERPRIIAEIMEFAGTDLTCYRAESPEALIALQAKSWDAPLAWAAANGARFTLTSGLLHQQQPEAALAAFQALLEAHTSPALCTIHNLTTLTGSAVLAAAIAAKAVTAEEAWTAAHVDEDWQIAHWGEDAEAKARREGRKREFEATLRFLDLSSSRT